MPIKVSVIIPVYNTEKYLQECVDSLLNQTLREVEFIFVDDGSTDNSVRILEEYQRKDTRVKIIKQRNQYAGVARNNGMKVASGKYLLFVDSDDYFELTMLEKAYNTAEENNAEIVMFGYRFFDDQKKTIVKTAKNIFPKRVFNYDDLNSDFFSSILPAPWNKLYLKKFIIDNNIQYQNTKKCNDTYFTRMTVIFAKRMVYIPQIYVNYRTNNSSSLQGNRKNTQCFIEAGKAIRTKVKSLGLYSGKVKIACDKEMRDLIKAGMPPWNNIEEQKNYFEMIKSQLMPDLFDDSADIEKFADIKMIFNSSDFTDYMKRTIIDLQEKLDNGIEATVLDYRIGHFLLGIPRQIWHLIKSMWGKV